MKILLRKFLFHYQSLRPCYCTERNNFNQEFLCERRSKFEVSGDLYAGLYKQAGERVCARKRILKRALKRVLKRSCFISLSAQSAVYGTWADFQT